METLLNLIFAFFTLLFPKVEEAPAPPPPAPVISTIGGTPVPEGLDCYEDEVIGFIAIDTLGCVHIDNL